MLMSNYFWSILAIFNKLFQLKYFIYSGLSTTPNNMKYKSLDARQHKPRSIELVGACMWYWARVKHLAKCKLAPWPIGAHASV